MRISVESPTPIIHGEARTDAGDYADVPGFCKSADA